MYVPLYPAGELYHPVSLLHGTAASRIGPWSWKNLTGVIISINPGALVYTDPLSGAMHYTLWVSHPDHATVGAVSATSPDGPFTDIPNSNTTNCSINPSPLLS